MHRQIIPREQLLGDLERLDEELAAIKVEIKDGGEKMHAALNGIREQITERFNALDHKRRVSIAALHSDLTKTRERIAAVESRTEANTQELHAHAARLNAAPPSRGR